MIKYLCPQCGETELTVERTILDDEMFEEVSCPRCGYYDSNIECLNAEKPDPNVEFKF